jgi:FtsH-binding integral membrane protein
MTTEPVAYTELARAVIVVLVSLGWITLDNTTVNVVASSVGLVLSWALTLYARSRVTPVTPVSPVAPPVSP